VTIVFSEHAWDDYLYWQRTDRKILARINKLIQDITNARLLLLTKSPPGAGFIEDNLIQYHVCS
jgi:toxin YoeB